MRTSVSYSISLCVVLSALGLQAVAAESSLTWLEWPPLPNAEGVASPFVGVHNDGLIVAGGANFPDRPRWETGKVWHADIFVLVQRASGVEWVRPGYLPRPLAYGASVSTPAGVVCMGGNDANETYADVFLLCWDSERETISRETLPPLPAPCAYGSATLVDGVVYLAGGQRGDALESAMNNLWSLDLRDQGTSGRFAWRVHEDVPWSPRAFNITVAQRYETVASLFVMSGRAPSEEGPRFLRDVWRYTPSTGTWTACADLPEPRMAGVAVAPANSHRILVVGGDHGVYFHRTDELQDEHPGFPREALAYDVAADTWSSAGRIPANHVSTVPVPWDDEYVIASGEVRPRVRSAKVWRLVP